MIYFLDSSVLVKRYRYEAGTVIIDKIFDDHGRCKDAKTEKMLRSLATNLIEYIQSHVCPLPALEETVRDG